MNGDKKSVELGGKTCFEKVTENMDPKLVEFISKLYVEECRSQEKWQVNLFLQDSQHECSLMPKK